MGNWWQALLFTIVAVAHAQTSLNVGVFDSGEVQCDATIIQRANAEYLRKVLEELVNTTYFRLFRVQLDGPCPLDPKKKDGEAAAASQCTGDPSVFGGLGAKASPPSSSSASSQSLFPSSQGGTSCEVQHTPVDMTLSPKEDFVVAKSEEDCNDDGHPTFWMDLCSKLSFKHPREGYVNLKLNPETYTGYNGTKEWKAIYSQNCFDDQENELCYEERFLYRLLSGLHSSINLHISHSYYPPREGVRSEWAPNLARFEKQFVGHEERFKNLQFAFVVLLRAIRRASPVLEKFNYESFNKEEKYKTKALVKLFLDSHVLSTCQGVFEAFDESLLFEDKKSHRSSTMSNLKRRFKGVFHNISSTFDCVKCQKCRLHGKLQLLGIGTAIKLLLLPEELIQESLGREEVVALFNTIEKFSHSLEIYEQFKAQVMNRDNLNISSSRSEDERQNAALRAIVQAVKGKRITSDQEDQLVDATMDKDKEIMMLAEHFALNGELDSFVRHSVRRLGGGSTSPALPDAIIIGAGLSGLTATISILDRGGSVVLIDKERIPGGNSAKASSGINGIDLEVSKKYHDSVEVFRQDVLRGSGHEAEFASNPLVDVLTQGSVDSLQWLRQRIHLPLTEVGQLGGHSKPRTWRPSTGLAGSEMVGGLNKALKDTAKSLPKERFSFLTSTRVQKLVVENGDLVGVECLDLATNKIFQVKGRRVIIATGGYSYHHSPDSLLNEVRPDLKNFGTTNGKFATGDGIRIAQQVGGAIIDIDQVQIHPTAFVDRKDPFNPVKTLAAELLRGIGAVILTPSGERFVNELGTRKYVSEKMLTTQPHAAQPEFLMLLNAESAEKAPKHIPLYSRKGLLKKYDSLEELAADTNVTLATLQNTLTAYDKTLSDPAHFPDPFNRTVFSSGAMLGSPSYYAGWITPAIHYTMGGLKINENGQVLSAKDNKPLLNGKVYAIGETTGGIHGENRLGGNGLTECAVFGRHVGTHIPIETSDESRSSSSNSPMPSSSSSLSLKKVSLEELRTHNSESDCWVAIKGNVFDLTSFAKDHPSGPEAIHQLCGSDGTEKFLEIHGLTLLEDFSPAGQLDSD